MKKSSGHARFKVPEEDANARKRPGSARRAEASDRGLPGGGAGRRDEVGRSGVYPASGPRPDKPDLPIRDQASWGQGERGAAGYNDSGTSEVFYMPSELPEDVVGQGKNQKNATGEGSGSGVPAGQTPEDMGWRGEKAQKGHQGQGKKGQAGQGGPRSSDPNRQPADDAALYNEDKQGNTFYDKNTEIKRESEFHDATAAPLGDDDKKVKPENDQFGKK